MFALLFPTYDPAIPLPGIYPEKKTKCNLKDACTPIFVAAPFTLAKAWKLPKCALADERETKTWSMCIDTMKCDSAIKNGKCRT